MSDQAAKQLIELLKQNPSRIARYDLNNDGVIDGAEWELITMLARNEVAYWNRRQRNSEYTLLDEDLRIGAYSVLGVLGEGGQATTYLSQNATGDHVVLKERRLTDVESWKVVELFEREAEILAHLDHPGIPKYIDRFEVEDENGLRLYIVQEFVDGKNLEEIVQTKGPISNHQLQALLAEMLTILSYLHSQNPPVIHRDIKPSNILVNNATGRFHLIDFGSVQVSNKELGGSTVTGTFGYAPLEQFTGRAVPASDIYSLGATIVESITGVPPFDWTIAAGKVELAGFNLPFHFVENLNQMLDPFPEPRPSLDVLRTFHWLQTEPEQRAPTPASNSVLVKSENATFLESASRIAKAVVAGKVVQVESLYLTNFELHIDEREIRLRPQTAEQIEAKAQTKKIIFTMAVLFFVVGLVSQLLLPYGWIFSVLGVGLALLGASFYWEDHQTSKSTESIAVPFLLTEQQVVVCDKVREWSQVRWINSRIYIHTPDGEVEVHFGEEIPAKRIQRATQSLKKGGQIKDEYWSVQKRLR